MGLTPFLAWEKRLTESGPLVRQDSDAVFRFGNNGRLKALFSAEVDIWLFNKAAFLFVTIAAGQMPLLLGRSPHTFGSKQLVVDFVANKVNSVTLGLRKEALKEHEGHLVLDLMNTTLPFAGCAA